MFVKELYKVCKKAVEDGKGGSNVMFDTEAATFDVHLVEVDSADIEPLMEDDLILVFKRYKGVCHSQKSTESQTNDENSKIKKCPSCGVELYKTSPPYIEGFCGKCYKLKQRNPT